MAAVSSILLNSPAQSPALVPQSLPSYPASTVSSASSADMHIYRSASAPTPTRRIRFAPLPETASVDTPTRTESPPSLPTPSSPTPTASIISNSSKTKSKSTFLRQLNIFKRSPLSSPIGPLSPVIESSPRLRFSTEDVLTLGTSRLLRRPRTPDHGVSLSRTTSAREPKRPSTAPESKSRSSINSLGSGGGRHPMPPKAIVSSTSSSPTSPARATVPKKSGMRMLNGRVYGSRRNSINSNPFANVRDEPEFVEWGYGGMGSVSGSNNSKYSVLATGSPALLSHSQNQKAIIGGGRGGAAKVAVERIAEDDDGSGMGWVRKRREERERLAKEKEAQESRAIAEARRSGEMTRSSLDNTVASALDTDSRRTSTDGSSALDTDLSTLAASSAPTTPPSTTDTLPFTGVTSEEEEQHILHAVRLSPKHTHHHHPHHRLPSAQGHSPDNQDLVVGTTIGTLEPDKSSPMSESSSDADEEEETPKEDDDDDSSIEQTEDQRKTSLGAGVEKISRHKEVLHKDGDR